MNRLTIVQAGEFEVVVRVKGWHSAGQFMRHAPQRIEVGQRPKISSLAEHLRRRIPEVVRKSVELKADAPQRQGQISQYDPVLTTQEDVGRLDGPVQHLRSVERPEGVKKLTNDLDDLVSTEDSARLEKLLKRDAVNIIANRIVDLAVREGSDFSRENQVVMDQPDRSAR